MKKLLLGGGECVKNQTKECITNNKLIAKKIYNNDSIAQYYPLEAVVRFLAEFKNKNELCVLDWGCAHGRHLAVAARFGFGNLIGADVAAAALEFAKNRIKIEYPNAKLKTILNDEYLDIKAVNDKSVDAIICTGVLWLNTRQNMLIMLKNMKRMLKNDGKIFVDFRCCDDDLYFGKEEFVIGKESHLAGFSISILSKEKLKELFKEAHLKLISFDKYEFSYKNKLNSYYHVILGE